MLVLSIWILPVVIFVLFAVRQRSQTLKAMDSVERSVDIHKSRLSALQAQFENGELTEVEYHSFRVEEEKSMLADAEITHTSDVQASKMSWLWVPVLSVSIIVLAFGTYLKVGSYEAVKVRDQFKQLATVADLDEKEVAATLDSYRQLLESEPENIEGWFRLSRMQSDMKLFEGSVDSLQHVLTELRKQVEHNAEDEATVLSYIGQNYVALAKPEEALAAFEESLEYLQNSTALGMAGRMSYELGQFKKAIDYWTQLKLSNPQAESTVVDDFIELAKTELTNQGIDYEAEQSVRIVVNIELPAAWEGLSKDAALFVYARPIGQRMPLAVKRMPVSSASIAVMLSDADAMGPMGGISGQDVVELTARVSLTGIANTQAGDWIGDIKTVEIDGKEMTADIQIRQP